MNDVLIAQLTHGSHVRADAWHESAYAKLFTVFGFAVDTGQSPEKLIARSLLIGSPLVGSTYVTEIVCNSPTVYELRRRERLRVSARSVVLASGDIVDVDGLQFVVQFAPGSEFCEFPRNVDPVRFELV